MAKVAEVFCIDGQNWLIIICPGVCLQDEIVKGVAKKLGKTPTQVLLRWGLQHGSSVLPKSTNPEHLKVFSCLQRCLNTYNLSQFLYLPQTDAVQHIQLLELMPMLARAAVPACSHVQPLAYCPPCCVCNICRDAWKDCARLNSTKLSKPWLFKMLPATLGGRCMLLNDYTRWAF